MTACCAHSFPSTAGLLNDFILAGKINRLKSQQLLQIAWSSIAVWVDVQISFLQLQFQFYNCLQSTQALTCKTNLNILTVDLDKLHEYQPPLTLATSIIARMAERKGKWEEKNETIICYGKTINEGEATERKKRTLSTRWKSIICIMTFHRLCSDYSYLAGGCIVIFHGIEHIICLYNDKIQTLVSAPVFCTVSDYFKCFIQK